MKAGHDFTNLPHRNLPESLAKSNNFSGCAGKVYQTSQKMADMEIDQEDTSAVADVAPSTSGAKRKTASKLASAAAEPTFKM